MTVRGLLMAVLMAIGLFCLGCRPPDETKHEVVDRETPGGVERVRESSSEWTWNGPTGPFGKKE